MLHQRCTRMIFKQVFECKTVCNSFQVNVTRSFYNNREAIIHFIYYLRKRQVNVGTKPYNWRDVAAGPPRGMFVRVEAPNTYDFFTFRLKDWWKHKKEKMREMAEDFEYEKTVKLGPDLAAAMFIIKIGGKVRFKNHDEWIDNTKRDKLSQLPNKFDENYILEEMDLNGYPLRYEHLRFIFNLYSLKSLSFRGCKSFNDWSLDKISAEYPMLECLDISECENVTERGLEALYRMPNLKKLTVTNFHGTAAFELTCFMLEDVNPYLTCQIQRPQYKTLPDK